MPTHDETRGDVDYFVLLIIMASFLLLNVFVAIILDNFKQEDEWILNVDPLGQG